jgi:DNA helicase-2/ATP-dependent DNA helicase PcrA
MTLQTNDLSHLNPAQREAVLHTEGPLLIVAGAGAGKTKTLTERIVHIILSGTAPENILAVTFTNKAAGEMRERVLAAITARRIEGIPTITTFHRLGGSIIREHAGYFGLTKYFSIFDEDDGKALIRESMREFGIDPKLLDPKRVKHIISENKMAGETPDTLAEKVASQAESDAVRIWRSYEAKLQKSKGVDFDDLIVKSVRLLTAEPDIRAKYQERYKYVHVDEYQDTNEMEYRMVKMLAGERKNICVVGDTDQNIYSWRGAKIKNMLHFEKDFPGAHTVFLEENYRSTSRILEAANAVIQKNTVRIPKNLFTSRGTGEKIVRYEGFSETDEAAFVARESEKLIASGIQPEEIAVLFRANFQSRVLEEAFLYADVPYRMIGTQFFERAEVKDIIAYIRAAMNRDSLADIKRTVNKPKRGIGDTSVAKIFAGMTDQLSPKTRATLAGYEKILDVIQDAAEHEYPSALIRTVLDKSGLREEYEDEGEQGIERIENVGELATLASIYDTLPLGDGVMKFLEDAALRADSDALAESPEGVRLLTVHASKGLEFRVVFIVGLEEGLFPHERASRAAKVEDAEEERRLFYVALTRAKERIFLTHAQSRMIFGSRNISMPSQFLFDIPKDLIQLSSDMPQSLPSIFFE